MYEYRDYTLTFIYGGAASCVELNYYLLSGGIDDAKACFREYIDNLLDSEV